MNLSIRRAAFLWAALLVIRTSCTEALADPASPAPPLKNAGPPPTEKEAKQFADRLTRAVQAGDAAAIDKLLHLPDLAERIISDLELSDRNRKVFVAGMANALREMSLGKQILQAIKDNGSYKLLHIHKMDGRPRALFRLIHSDGAVNYHDFSLVRLKNGNVATEDMFVFATGEPFTQTTRRLVLPVLVSLKGKGLLLRANQAEELRTLQTVNTMFKAVRSGDFKSADAAYRRLPRSYQEQKSVLIVYLQATMNLEGDSDYLAALEKFRKLYPKDPAVDFISIDYYFLKKQYDEARKAMDRLNKAVGGDPYLDMLRGTAWMEAGRFEEARRAIEKTIKAEPDIIHPYWTRVTLALLTKKHEDTLKWLKVIVEKFHLEIRDLTSSPLYADFVKSPQYEAWKKWYAGRNKGKDQPEKKETAGSAGRRPLR